MGIEIQPPTSRLTLLRPDEKEMLKPLPPLASYDELLARLRSLQLLRVEIAARMRDRVGVLDMVRYQGELAVISGVILATMERIRAQGLLPKSGYVWRWIQKEKRGKVLLPSSK